MPRIDESAKEATGRRIVWEPNPGPQTRLLETPIYDVLYGGAVGGGKSSSLLVDAARYAGNPHYRALLLRRTYGELKDSLIPRSREIYPQLGAKASGYEWRFPGGGVIQFGHVQHEADVSRYLSAEYQYLGFDELTTFTEKIYLFLLGRLRTSHAGIPLRVRGGTNPGGIGHDWVVRRFAPWLDEKDISPAKSGEPRYALVDRQGRTTWVPRGTPGARGRMFIQSLVTDNRWLMQNDPTYAERLNELPEMQRKRLRDGDWRLFEDPQALWRRGWFSRSAFRLDRAPELRRVVIAVDPSGSAKKTADNVGIVAAGVGPCTCLGKEEDHMFVLEDGTTKLGPQLALERAIEMYHRFGADCLVAEDNFGGEMVRDLVKLIDPTVRYKSVHASRGKFIRAEPVAGAYETGKCHHCGSGLQSLEDVQCTWTPLHPKSPGDLDALVWAGTELMLNQPVTLGEGPVVEGTRRASEERPDDDDDDHDAWGRSRDRSNGRW